MSLEYYNIFIRKPNEQLLSCHPLVVISAQNLILCLKERKQLIDKPFDTDCPESRRVKEEVLKCEETIKYINGENKLRTAGLWRKTRHLHILYTQKCIERYVNQLNPVLCIHPILVGQLITCQTCENNYLSVRNSYIELGIDRQLCFYIDQILVELERTAFPDLLSITDHDE